MGVISGGELTRYMLSAFSAICVIPFIVSCAAMPIVDKKASPLLIAQVQLRQQQLSNPSIENLDLMKKMGMQTDNVGIQRIFIYSSQRLNEKQTGELKAIGVNLYLDSWIPPVGSHPAGFMLADIPIDKLAEVASKDYIAMLDTAEQFAQPNQ